MHAVGPRGGTRGTGWDRAKRRSVGVGYGREGKGREGGWCKYVYRDRKASF